MQGPTDRPSNPLWPPTLRQRRWRYATFFSTYLYQGLIAGFSLTALANAHAARGADPGEIGLHAALAGLPWTFQPLLWGPPVDRAGQGRRRIWGVSAIAAGHVCLAGLFFAPGLDALALVGAMFFLHSLFASLLDTVSDRLIMDHVPTGELGRMSACTRIGFVTGASVGGALFAYTLATWDFRHSVLLLFGLSLAAALLPILVRERPGDPLLRLHAGARRIAGPVAPSFARFLRRLSIGLRRPAALRLLLLCFGVDFAFALFEIGFTVDLIRRQGWDPLELSRVQAVLTLVSGTAGALAIGFWSDRAGALPALRVLFAGVAGAFAVAIALIAMDAPFAGGAVILGLTAVLPSLVIVALVPALMQASGRRVGAATEFETYMAALNLGSVVGAALSGPVLAITSPIAVLVLIVLVCLAGAQLAGHPSSILRQRSS